MKGLANQLVLANLLSTACSAPSATIDSGVIVGVAASLPSFENEVNQFLGIPFAQPPVGNGRFAPPQKVKPWSMPKNTTAYGPSCVQQFNCMHVSPIAISQLITPDPTALRDFAIEAFDTPGPPAGESEDCLYINVFVPAGVGHNMTVMFWIYGGNLLFGSNSMIYFDGTSFAANQDVIVVAPNYRTNGQSTQEKFR
jgi:carboxylesterase type B